MSPNDTAIGGSKGADAHTLGSGVDRRSFLKLAGGSAVATTGFAGCVGSRIGGNPDEVLVGQPASLTGKWDYLQPAVSQATDLAVSEINEAGGPLGATFNVKRRDTAVKPQRARQVVRQFINNDDAVALDGLFSSEIVPLWSFLQNQTIPVVTPWPGTTFLDTRGGDKMTPSDLGDDGWVWRTVIGDTVHTSGAAKAMIDNDFTRMGILSGTSAGETGWTKQFVNHYENLGGTVTKLVEVSEGQASYQSQLEELFSADFQAWGLSLALEDANTAIRNWANAGYGRQLLLEDGLRSQDLIKAVGQQAEGAWIATGSTRGPNYDSFISKFEEAGDASIHPWGVAAYDSTNVIALAIHHAGATSHDAIEQSIGAVARGGGTKVSTFAEGKEELDGGNDINYHGAVTNTDFTRYGNVWGTVGVARVTPDGFEQAFTISPKELRQRIQNY